VLGTLDDRLRATLEGAGALLVEAPQEEPTTREFLAIFGALRSTSSAREAALRAVIAARQLVREAAPHAWQESAVPLALSAGVDTVRALIATPARGGPLSPRAVPLEVARLLASRAAGDTILVDAATAQGLDEAFPLARAEPTPFQGTSVRVPCSRLEPHAKAARGRSARLLTGRLDRPLLGRSAELQAVCALVDQASQRREPARVTVTGAVGVGRTRFVREVISCLRGTHSGLRVAAVDVARPDAPALPFGLLGALTRAVARLDPARSSEGNRAALARCLEETYGGSGTPLSETDEVWLRHLAGVEEAPGVIGEDPELASEISYRAVADLLRTSALGAPLLIVVEDLAPEHGEELALLGRLSDDLAGSPTVLLLSSSQTLSRPPAWRPMPGRELDLTLGPLKPEPALVLIDHVLERRDALPVESARAIVTHAHGIPLVIEETLASLVEAGLLAQDPDTSTWELTGGDVPPGLPDTVEGLIAARIDQMPEGHAAVLRKASVVGDVFWRALIEDLGEPQASASLRALEEAGMVKRDYGHSLEGHVGYRFAHATTREVAYRDVPADEAAALHGRVARWLAVHTGDQFQRWLGAIAWHFAAAGEHAQAASYYLQAGRWARGRGDIADTVRQLERGRSIAQEPEVAMECAAALGEALFYAGRPEEAREALEEVLEWTERHRDLQGAISALTLLARVANGRGDGERGYALSTRARGVARTLGNTRAEGLALLELSQSGLSLGREAEALAFAEEAGALFAEMGDDVGRLRASLSAALPLLHQGRLVQAEIGFEEARRFATELNHWLLARVARLGDAWIRLLHGRHASADVLFAEAVDTFGRVRAPALLSEAHLGRALALVGHAEFAAAANAAAAGFASARASGHRTLEALGAATLGHVYGVVELGHHRVRAKELTAAALEGAKRDRLQHLVHGAEVLGPEAPAPRLYRLLAQHFLASYLQAKAPTDPRGPAAANAARALATGFDDCPLLRAVRGA